MSEVVWKQSMLNQLKQRNSALNNVLLLIKRCIELQQSDRRARGDLSKVTQEKSLLLNRVEDLEEKVKFGLVNAQAKEREEKLQLELNAALKESAITAKQKLEMHEKIKEYEERLSEKTNKIDQYVTEIKNLQNQIALLDSEVKEKEEKILVLRGELRTLQTTLVKSEETVQQLKRENKRLEQRAIKQRDDDASRVVDAHQFFQSLNANPPAPLSELSNSLSASTPGALGGGSTGAIGVGGTPVGSVNLDPSIKAPIGAYTVPKTSKRSFLAHSGEVSSIAFSNNGGLFATGGSDKNVKVWDTYTLATKQTLTGPERTIMHVIFSPNDDSVMAASNDNAIRVWSLQTGRVKHCLLGHLSKVYAAHFTLDGEKTVTGSHDRTIKVWDLQRRSSLKTIFCFSSCNDLCLTRDNGLIISGHLDQQLRFWDMKNGESVKELTNIHSGQITGVILSPDGKTVLTNSRDNTMKLIDIRTFEILQTYQHEGYKNGLNWSRPCFSPDGRYIAAGSTTDGTVYIWDTTTSTVEQMLRGVHRNSVTQVSWHRTGYQVASVDRAGYIAFWG